MAEEAKKEAVKAAPKRKKKAKLTLKRGQAHIQATYNNTIITITDQNGNAVAASSAGACGFKGPKKSTPYAAGIIVRTLMDRLKESGLQQVDVFVKGVGSGREGAVRALHANGLEVISIKDLTPIPHNGCRAPKPRRV
ncbi:MAG: 30S ribosomal protein S11 [Candidatus Komeilibacteria bacterium]|nr:30S ribosomal protein S11 [Candidatus Komeilibacteria bacterium]